MCSDDYKVWGSIPYTYDSSSCRSALHSGSIDVKGGLYYLQAFEIYDSFNWSTINGITSDLWDQNSEGMKIK